MPRCACIRQNGYIMTLRSQRPFTPRPLYTPLTGPYASAAREGTRQGRGLVAMALHCNCKAYNNSTVCCTSPTRSCFCLGLFGGSSVCLLAKLLEKRYDIIVVNFLGVGLETRRNKLGFGNDLRAALFLRIFAVAHTRYFFTLFM